MIDPKLDEQIEATQQLLQYWQRFHDYFAFGVKGTEVDQQREREFLQIKSQVAMLHDFFMDALTHDRNIGQNIMGICSRSITLKNLKRLSNADIQKMEIEWHESYLLLNETLGALQEKRQKIANINPVVFKTKRALNNFKIQIGNLFKQGWVKALLVLILIVGALVGVFASGLVNMDSLKGNKYTKPLYDLTVKLNPNAPFGSFDDVKRKTDWPGSEVKLETALWGTSSVRNNFFPNNGIYDQDGRIAEILEKNSEVYYAVETQPNSNQTPPAEIIMVRFPENNQATEFIYRLNSEYNQMRTNTNQPAYMQAFAIRNIAVMISSSDSELSRQIKQREFGQ